MRAWGWCRDEKVQRPNKPLQQTKRRRLRVVAVTTILSGLRIAAEWQPVVGIVQRVPRVIESRHGALGLVNGILIFRDIEDLLAQRGIIVTHETTAASVGATWCRSR